MEESEDKDYALAHSGKQWMKSKPLTQDWNTQCRNFGIALSKYGSDAGGKEKPNSQYQNLIYMQTTPAQPTTVSAMLPVTAVRWLVFLDWKDAGSDDRGGST